MNIVLNRTVVVDSDWRFDNLCSSHLWSQSELYHVSWWYHTLAEAHGLLTLGIDVIGQLRRDGIGRLSSIIRGRRLIGGRLLFEEIRYSIGNPTLSHEQLCENYIKRARLLWGLKLQVLSSNLIPLRTKLDTQTTVITHRRTKRFSSSAGFISRSEFSDRRHNTSFCDKSIVFLRYPLNLREASQACYELTLISGTSFFSQWYVPSSGRSKIFGRKTSLYFKTNKQRGQHYWSTIGRHLLSRTVFITFLK